METIKIPQLLLHTVVSKKWLEKSHEKVIKQLNTIDHVFRFKEKIDIYKDPIVMKDFEMYNLSNINVKYARLIKEVLDTFEVIGIWRNYLVGTDVIIGIRIYGYKNDVSFAHNMLHYLLNGFDRYYDNHTAELRRKRKNRRLLGIKIVQEVDARKRTNQNIKNKVDMILKILQDTTLVRCPYPIDRVRKKEFIITHIQEIEKIHFKRYRGQKEITVKTMYSRVGRITPNRLI